MEKLIQMLLEYPYGVVLILVILFADCIRQIFISNIEMLFIGKKEEAKKFIAGIIVMSFLLLIMNYLMTFNNTFLAFDIILFLLCFGALFIMWILKMYGRICKKNTKTLWKKTIENLYLRMIMFAVPIVIYFISVEKDYKLNQVIILISVLETFIIFIRFVGEGNKETEVELINFKNKERYYVYKKINEEYLLCGDTPEMKVANKIVPIEIKEVYAGNYFLKLRKDTEIQICKETKENNLKE